MTLIIIIIILFIVLLFIGFYNAEKEKRKEAERQTKREEIRKRLDEERRVIQKELEDTRLEDMENMVLYEKSTLGRYTFNVKGLTHRSKEDQDGAKLLRTCCPLRLQHDEGNEYDPFAMRVYSVTGDFFLGYVERSKSMELWSVKDNIKACIISSFFNGKQAPYITATAYFQKEKDGVLQPYTLGTKKMNMPSEINIDNTVQTYRSYISKSLKKAEWNERTFNEVQARTNFLLSNGIKISEKTKEELRTRGIKVNDFDNT